jgi:hypothetical protein
MELRIKRNTAGRAHLCVETSSCCGVDDRADRDQILSARSDWGEDFQVQPCGAAHWAADRRFELLEYVGIRRSQWDPPAIWTVLHIEKAIVRVA